jgi:hypothetical protein
MSVRPYPISVPDAGLKELSQRLALTKFPTQLNGDDQWETGVPLSEVYRLIKYWKDGFDWRKAESQGPGSFIEVKKFLPLLNCGKGLPAFPIVAPSLPNFGFSDRVTKRGFGIAKYAETLHKLMLKLGYNEYGMKCMKSQTKKRSSQHLLIPPSYSRRRLGVFHNL